MADSDALGAFLQSTRTIVDAALERYLVSSPTCPAIVSDAMRYSLFAGGKRLRPVLTMAAADAVARATGRPAGPESEAVRLALPAACALEMIHTYSLIHDDLPAMDNDSLRRGRPTLHVVYGEGIAILAGDALQAEAFGLLALEPRTGVEAGELARRQLRVLAIVADAAGASGMVGGQAIDLEAAGQVTGRATVLDAGTLPAMHRRKTGAIIRAAAVSGAVMAGADDSAVAGVDRFAGDIGLAFQIVDDILDVEGNAGELGKTVGKDAASGKPTYPSLFGIDRSRQMAAECLDRARQTLHDTGLSDGWLASIAEWVVTRRN